LKQRPLPLLERQVYVFEALTQWLAFNV